MVALSNCAPKGVVSVEQVSGSLLHEYMKGEEFRDCQCRVISTNLIKYRMGKVKRQGQKKYY